MSNCARSFTVPVVVSIVIVDGEKLSGRKLRRVGAIERGYLECRSGVELSRDRGKIVLGQAEQCRDRLHLVDHDEAIRLVGRDVIALVDLTQADAAVHRRNNVAISDVELVGVDHTLIRLDLSFFLFDEPSLVLDRLHGDRVLLLKGLVAREIRLRLLQQSLVFGERSLRLLERGLVGPRIDQFQEIALLYPLAFRE